MCFMNREGSYNLKLTNGYNKEKLSVAICYPQVECSWRNKIKVPSQCMFEEAHSYRLLATLQLELRSMCRRLGFQPETLLGDDGHWPHGRNLGIEGRGLEADIEPPAFLFVSWPPWGEQLPLPHVLPWRTLSPQTQSHHALKPWVPGAKTNLSSPGRRIFGHYQKVPAYSLQRS